MPTRHVLARAAIACLALALPAGCERPAADTTHVAGAPLTIGLTSADVNVGPLARILTTASLVGTAPDGRPTPALLQTWTVSNDGLTWEFTVRPGVVSHTGRPVTAATVVERIDSQRRDGSLPGLLDVDAVDVIDPLRLRVRLRAPSSLLLEALTLSRAVAAGPFLPMEDGVTQAGTPTLVGRTRPDGTPPSVTRVVFRRYDSPRSAWAALMRDEIDLLHEVSGDARPFLERTPGVEVRPFLRPYVVTFGLNVRHPALRSTSVRRALNHAIDRAEILSRDLGGLGQIAAGPITPRHWAADPAITGHAFDPALARRLLDEAGLTVRQGGVRGPTRVRLSCILLDDQPRLERVALRVQRSLAAVGIDLQLEPVPVEDLEPRLASGRFDTYLVPVLSGNGLNPVYGMWGREYRGDLVDHGYTSAEEALDRLRRAPTDAAFTEALRDVQRILHEDPPAVFLAWEEAARAVGRRFIVPPSVGRDILSSIAQWRPRPPEDGGPS